MSFENVATMTRYIITGLNWFTLVRQQEKIDHDVGYTCQDSVKTDI